VMPLRKKLRFLLGRLRRDWVGSRLGWYVEWRRVGGGFVFGLHRSQAFTRLLQSCFHDLVNYWGNAFGFEKDAAASDAGLMGRMTALSHGLEKGLSHPERKDVFGVQYVDAIVALIRASPDVQAVHAHGRFPWILGTLKEWYEHHQCSVRVPAATLQACRKILSEASGCTALAAAQTKSREAIQTAARGDFREMALARHSVRDFDDREVDSESIVEAVELALRSPSACNRQSVRVVCLSRGAQMDAALELQNGNKGFREKINKLLIVGFDMRGYLADHERNLGYVDSGLFLMSLVHALHYQGLGTCCLNWAVDAHTDKALHERVGLPEYLNVACLLAVGHLPEMLTVAASHRIKSCNALEFRNV